MRRFIPLVVAVMAVAFGLVAVGGAAQPVSADITTWSVRLTGAQEIPAVTNDSVSAFVRFRFDDVTQNLQYDLTVSGASADLITAAHIHRGGRSVNGPIIHTISDKGFTQISGTMRLSDGDLVDLLLGDLYINVHSKQNPGGAARAQVDLPITAQDVVAAFRRYTAIGNRANIEALFRFVARNATLADGRVCLAGQCAEVAELQRLFASTAGANALLAGIDPARVGFNLNDPQVGRFFASLTGGSRIAPPATGSAGLLSE